MPYLAPRAATRPFPLSLPSLCLALLVSRPLPAALCLSALYFSLSFSSRSTRFLLSFLIILR